MQRDFQAKKHYIAKPNQSNQSYAFHAKAWFNLLSMFKAFYI